MILLPNDFASELLLPNDFAGELSIPNDLLTELTLKPTIDNGQYAAMLAAIDADSVVDLPMLVANESGTDTTDVSGEGNDAALINSPTKLATAGYRVNNTVEVQSLQIADDPTMRLTTQGTISVLLKNVDLSGLSFGVDWWSTVYSRYDAAGENGFYMYFLPISDWSAGLLVAGLFVDGLENNVISAMDFIFDSKHALITWDLPTVKLYIDAELVMTWSYDVTPPTVSNVMTIGDERVGISFYDFTAPLPADFCRIKVVNRMVSEAEARILFSEASRDSFKI